MVEQTQAVPGTNAVRQTAQFLHLYDPSAIEGELFWQAYYQCRTIQA